jgi:hypothetical protein
MGEAELRQALLTSSQSFNTDLGLDLTKPRDNLLGKASPLYEYYQLTKDEFGVYILLISQFHAYLYLYMRHFLYVCLYVPCCL